MANLAPSTRFDFGRVVERTFRAVGQNLVVFLLLSALLSALPIAIGGWLTVSNAGALRNLASGNGGAFLAALGASGGMFGVTAILGAVAHAILQAALIYGTVVHLNGRRADFGACISVGLRSCLWLVLLGIVVGLGEIAGFIFLVVPGIIVMLAWIVAAPALVVERRGIFGSMGRSADLTRNHRWAIFGLVLIYTIATGVVRQALSSAVQAAVATDPFSPQFLIGQLITSAPLQIVVSVISAAGVASIYYELRSAKEGIGPEALAAVFD
jgi:hypothetical protein